MSYYIPHVDRIIEQLTESEIAAFYNGMGSELAFFRLFSLPAYYRMLFEPAVIFHDVAYFVGGTESNRDEVDAEFYRRCLELSKKAPGRLRSAAWARIAFYAVTLGGSISFEYLARARTLKEMQDYAQLRTKPNPEA